MDHIGRGSLNLNTVSFFVLDEADRMLDMGFVNDIREIAASLPQDKQTFCFSATFNEGVRKIADDFMNNPETISTSVNQTSDHIYQDIIEFSSKEDRKSQLINLLEKEDFDKVLQGIDGGDFHIKADALEFVKGDNVKELGIEIDSGQNRVVRRIFDSLGYKILRLDRVYFAGLTKKNLPRGKYRFLTEREVNILKMGAHE